MSGQGMAEGRWQRGAVRPSSQVLHPSEQVPKAFPTSGKALAATGRGWRRCLPLLSFAPPGLWSFPSEQRSPVTRVANCWGLRAAVEVARLLLLSFLPPQEKAREKRDNVPLNNYMPSLCRPVLSEVQPHVVPGPIRFS